jgi:hypothetical protein
MVHQSPAPRAPKRRSSADEPGRWGDLAYGIISRIVGALTSAKLWMTLLAIGFAAWNYQRGALSAEAVQAAITGAVALYLGADVVQNYGVQREAQRTETEREARRALEHHVTLRQMEREDEVREAPARIVVPSREAPR